MWFVVAAVMAAAGFAWAPLGSAAWWLCETPAAVALVAWLIDRADVAAVWHRRPAEESGPPPERAPIPVATPVYVLPAGVASMEAWRVRKALDAPVERPAVRPAARRRRGA